MFNRKNLIIMFAILVFLPAIPIIAADSGSARFVLTSDLIVAGTPIAKGQYKVSWAANNQDTKVTFTPIGNKDGITVEGKIEQVPNKYDYNNLAVGKDAEGRSAIRQLQFAGKNIRIVF
jgi:hypothetical protein